MNKIVKTVSGTGGEVLENRAYRQVLAKYPDPAVARGVIEAELHAAGETWDSLQTYLRVKQKIQND